MRLPLSLTFVTLASIGLGSPIAQAPKGVLVGVVQDDAGAPVADAQVVLASSDARVRRSTLSDRGGAFSFGDVPAGRYLITSSRAGYAMSPLLRTGPDEFGANLDLAAGAQVKDLRVRLYREAVIEGRVVDEDDEPVAGAHVSALTTSTSARGGFLERTSTSSDLDGHYRLRDLAPGAYAIAAGRESSIDELHQVDANGVDRIVTFGETFYADAATLQAATKVSVGYGDTRTGIDLRLRMVPASRIEVTMHGDAGQALSYSSARIEGPEGHAIRNFNNTAFPRGGRARFGHIAAGRYTIVARGSMSLGAAPDRTGNMPEVGFWGMAVVDSDGERWRARHKRRHLAS